MDMERRKEPEETKGAPILTKLLVDNRISRPTGPFIHQSAILVSGIRIVPSPNID